MKIILVFFVILASSAVIADDPVFTLRKELAGLNVVSPETDAKHDIAKGHAVCFSINGEARYFPGVHVKELEYCEEREKNFIGTWDIVISKEHGVLVSQARQYAERYNVYVLRHRQ